MPNDPLDKWMYPTIFDIPAERMAMVQEKMIEGLNRLTMWIEKPNAKRDMAQETGLRSFFSIIPPIPNDFKRAQELLLKVVETGGSGSTDTQETLLSLIAVTANPESLPFWQEALNLKHKKDRFRKKRQQMTLAALALLAIKSNNEEAYQALNQATHHKTHEVRSQAIDYLARAYVDGGFFDHEDGHIPMSTLRERYDSERVFPIRPIPQAVIDDMTHLARKDRAFTVRFKAREFLRFANQALPIDNPDGVYAFKLKFIAEPAVTRTIEVRSDQTLEELQWGIQRAIDWDNDHLYSFFMNNKLWDNDYAFNDPRAKDSPPWTDEIVIGDLGLKKKHKFFYFFDYGDSHKFEIQVVDIRAQADNDDYPRLVESQGEAPKQYPWAEEQYEGEDDEEWWGDEE